MVGSRLFRTGWRHLIRHGWQSALLVLGITLGVAVVTAVDLANDSASRSFELSMEQMTGRATHQIVGGPTGIPEQLYADLRIRQGLRPSAPVVEGLVRVRGETFTLLGLDPFAEKAFRPFLGTGGDGWIQGLLTRGDTLVMPAVSARRLGLNAGDGIQVEAEGRSSMLEVAAIVGEEGNAALDGLLLCDISTAQELLNRVGRLDRIDLILEETAAESWSRQLPDGLQLVRSGVRTAAMAKMSEAFQTNLRALSLLALLVGAFLIYNAMTFSVLRRRGLLGMLRVLGVTRGELFRLVLLEALVIGVAFVGILSALMALILDWRREHAILRATGLLPEQLLRLVILQTGSMGLMAGLLSLPLGWLMAQVLIDVINKRAFGWSIQHLLPVGIFAEALLFSLTAALLAGLYPAFRLMRIAPASALREE